MVNREVVISWALGLVLWVTGSQMFGWRDVQTADDIRRILHETHQLWRYVGEIWIEWNSPLFLRKKALEWQWVKFWKDKITFAQPLQTHIPEKVLFDLTGWEGYSIIWIEYSEVDCENSGNKKVIITIAHPTNGQTKVLSGSYDYLCG